MNVAYNGIMKIEAFGKNQVAEKCPEIIPGQ